MTKIKVRSIFSEAALDRLGCDEALMARDPGTGVELRFWFDHAGGTLRLAGGPLGKRPLCVGCDRADLNAVASVMLDGFRAQPR